jgi:histidinol dehydrogenase
MDTSRSVGDHRRDREAGCLVYPVVSRRSGGLSVGINLFPEKKLCSFDCPYCEVFPFEGAAPFEARDLGEQLDAFLDSGYAGAWAPEPVRDLCLSGNGEPSLSPHLGEALAICAAARRKRPELLGRAEIVVITNSTGFLSPAVSAVLARAVAEEGLAVWAKLDGGTEEAFARMTRSRYSLAEVVSGIASFAARSPVVIQTMLCRCGGVEPNPAEVEAYADTLAGLAEGGAKIRGVQLYTKARPSPEDSPESRTAPIGDARLAELARLVAARASLPVRAFGSSGEIGL